MPVNPDDERAALRYRHDRATAGPLGQAITDFANESPEVVREFLNQSDELREWTARPGELHRSLAPHIAAVMTEPGSRRSLMDALDETSRQESDTLKQQADEARNGLDIDLLVVGAGVQAAIFTAAYRAEFPEASILSVDRSGRIGGQFRSYGDRPVFRINSRANRREGGAGAIRQVGLPGGYGNLNSFGRRAPLQLPDITVETYPTDIDMGDVAAIDHRLSGESMLDTRLAFVNDVVVDGRSTTFLEDAQSGTPIRVNPRQVVVATGAGDRDGFPGPRIPNVWTAEELFAHFGNPNNPFPMKDFIGKRGAIIGGGDTGRVVAEIFARLAPKEAYGKSVAQLGGPRAIDWFGTSFANREEFCAQTRSRYEQLAPFIQPLGRFDSSLFAPYTRKVTKLEKLNLGSEPAVVLTDDSGLSTAYNFVIVATPIKPKTVTPVYGDGGPGTGELVMRSVPEFNNEFAAVARQSAFGTFTIGPAAQMPLTQFERNTFAEGIKENTAAIWANVIRTETFARELARIARALKKAK